MSPNGPHVLPIRTIMIGEQQYEVAYPLPSIFAYEDATGETILSPDPAAADGPKPKPSVRANLQEAIDLLWAGLLFKNKSITREEVGDMVHLGNVKYISEACFEALHATFPKKDEDATEDPPEAPAIPPPAAG